MLTASQLLAIWEEHRNGSPARRALALLAAAWPDEDPAFSEQSVGQRDARLLSLREHLFGSHLVCLADCAACGEKLELPFAVSDIRVEGQSDPAQPQSLALDGCQVWFRVPNGGDMVAVEDLRDVESIRRELLARCVLSAQREGADIGTHELPDPLIRAVEERMAQFDPQADIRLALVCPKCGHAGQAVFDSVSFLWREIEHWAYRVLGEVHALASAYGWREADILALTPWRRQYYLELIRQ